jgi:hypothetical protein
MQQGVNQEKKGKKDNGICREGSNSYQILKSQILSESENN